MNVAATHGAARAAVGALALAAVAVSALAMSEAPRDDVGSVTTSCGPAARHLALRDVHVVATPEAEAVRGAIATTANHACRSSRPVTIFISASGGQITAVTANDGDDQGAVECIIDRLPTELPVVDDLALMVSFDLVD